MIDIELEAGVTITQLAMTNLTIWPRFFCVATMIWRQSDFYLLSLRRSSDMQMG